MSKKIKAGIVGATGYTGVELLRLLAAHPDVEVAAVTSRSEAEPQLPITFQVCAACTVSPSKRPTRQVWNNATSSSSPRPTASP